jgi:cation transport ATPase
MLDRDEDEVVEASRIPMNHAKAMDSDLVETVQSLKSVVLLLKGLYGQMNEEREVITLASGQMAHSVKQFEQYLKQFESFEQSCKQAIIERVKTELKQSIQESAKAIAQEVTDIAYEPINRGINSLCQLSSEMAESRKHHERSRLLRVGLFLSAALLGGIVSGFTLHHLTVPSKEIKVKMAAGEALMRSWSKLTKAEQEKIFPAKG